MVVVCGFRDTSELGGLNKRHRAQMPRRERSCACDECDLGTPVEQVALHMRKLQTTPSRQWSGSLALQSQLQWAADFVAASSQRAFSWRASIKRAAKKAQHWSAEREEMSATSVETNSFECDG